MPGYNNFNEVDSNYKLQSCENQDVELTITPGIRGAIYEYQVGNGPRVSVGT